MFVAEPSAAPEIAELKVINSTSISVKWKPVPEQSTHGVITHYTIYYTDKVKNNNLTWVVKAPALEVTLNGLRQQAEYLFQILAATSKGDGPLSDPPKSATTKGEENVNVV